ncbi:DNA-binding transcriptional activator of the SARP family [Nocardioides exalbidus]|uniref:DNA-binding transcriptional activator of the SARP family n=1 Tax=Nocardioides exalbidus TaxID=402596 RepID=A0A1H4QNC3_9ACTN|nr:BTAD domain-containing putative transcriptional regulator [Nocardioides exalbidus]SEC21166.1 DNA-binding transcriptional activator of the SARP family [Nocardioides exalbidus]
MATETGRVEVLVLGACEVKVDGTVVPVTAAQQRVVLAALALAAGEPVSADTLCTHLWPEEVPATGRTSLHNSIRRLRTTLADAGAAPVLETGAAGYRLRLGPDDLDAARAERLVGVARAHAAADERAAALVAYDDALAAWRGEPLADLAAAGWLTGEAERLADLRLAATEEWADLARGSGLADRAVERLQPLAEAHPLRESLRAALVHALHDAGRSAEALEHYARARELLVGELGTEPGALLREAHARVLAFDVGEEPTSSALVVVPAQLPSPPARLVGRAAAGAALHRSLSTVDAGPVAWVVSGSAGVGKSAFAARWCHDVAERFPDGQLFVNLRGFDPGGTPLSAVDALRALLAGLGVPAEQVPQSLAEMVGAYRSLLSGRRVLVLLDNARDADQVAPLLPASTGSLAVVTSRDELTTLAVTHGVRLLSLDLLDDRDAREVFSAHLDAGRLEAEPGALAEILDRCGGLPLALAVAGARVASGPHTSLADLAAELRDSSLDSLTLGHPTTDVRAVLSWSYDALSADAAHTYRLVGLHPGPEIGVAALASMAGRPLRRVRASVDELVRASLVTVRRPGRLALHDLVAAHAGETAESALGAEEVDEVRRRLVDHVLRATVGATRTIFATPLPFALGPAPDGLVAEPLDDADQGHAWLRAELPVLQRVADLAAATPGLHAHAWRLARTLNGYLCDRSSFTELVALHESGLAAAVAAGDVVGEADSRHGLGEALTELDPEEAAVQLERARDLFALAGDRTGESDVESALGRLHESTGDYQRGITHTTRSLDLAREIGDASGTAVALNNLGWLYSCLGDHEASLGFCQEALEHYRRIGDRGGESYALDSAARAYLGLGDLRRAASMFAQAVEIGESLGHHLNQTFNLTHLGDAQHALGEVDRARASWTAALDLLEEVGHPRAESVRSRLALLDATPGPAQAR